MSYSQEIKKKALSLKNALENGDASIYFSIDVEYATPENLMIANNLLQDFFKEKDIKRQFQRWLLIQSF
jgi:hypothetical protein